MAFNFCPQCAKPLQARIDEGISRNACPDESCGYVHWDNPTPVVAAVVEHEGHIILARNRAWPVPFYALITGFLEKTDPSPEEAVMREVQEELNLQAQSANFIGHYVFPRHNQIIIAYHVPATGEIVLNDELVDYKRIEPAKARYWPAATGLALRDWLITQGHQPQAMDLPKL
ncbi:MAG TPA: NUDIX domain-containing protein [Aquabacterium sp.]|uniref:NUDIX domain-containing protein n=1 Tax=Aquabacterium sp. TaxID=1872578 RepID=UPI002E2F97E2|nr:NUDIX domain-containing protein [Aquabacterium sp.]HEX5354817.1 NUDIX domain-containing protein [Aquabacterium sp.]